MLESRPATDGGGAFTTRLVVTILGPNEEQFLPRFRPYAPLFNLKAKKKGLPLWGLPLIALGAAVLIVAPIGFFVTYMSSQTTFEIGETAKQADARRNENNLYEAALKRLEMVKKEKDAYDEVGNQSAKWTLLVDRLRDLLPPGVRLSGIKADAAGKILVEGQASSIRALGAYMLYLRASGYFQRPQLLLSERDLTPGLRSTIYNYEMSLRLSQAGSKIEEETDLKEAKEEAKEAPEKKPAETSSAEIPVNPLAGGAESLKALSDEAKKAMQDSQ